MLKSSILLSIRQAVAVSLVLSVSFMLFEPAISFGFQGTSGTSMTESLTIGKEVSMTAPTSNVTMAPQLGGITGGTAIGQTSFAIVSNDTGGYYVTLVASSSSGMQGYASSTNWLTAYKPGTINVPDKTFAVNNSTGVAFGYTVGATTTSDLATLFQYSGSNCNSAGSGNSTSGMTSATANCWLNASTTAVTIISRTQPTFTGGNPLDNYTLFFQTTINANPSPIIPNDNYVATTTILATAN